MRIPRAYLVVAIAALAAVAVAGCADRGVVYQPYPVNVPVPVPCAAQTPPEPDWATKDMPRVDPKTGQGIDVATDKLTAERQQRIGYEDKLKAAVAGCQ